VPSIMSTSASRASSTQFFVYIVSVITAMCFPSTIRVACSGVMVFPFQVILFPFWSVPSKGPSGMPSLFV